MWMQRQAYGSSNQLTEACPPGKLDSKLLQNPGSCVKIGSANMLRGGNTTQDLLLTRLQLVLSLQSRPTAS